MPVSHYFDPQPEARSRPREVSLVLPDITVRLQTDAAVFSPTRVDPGTKLLLLEGPEPDARRGPLLDLGCGYGPIAVTLALRSPQATVVAVDVNERARQLCRANTEAAGVADRVVVKAPDEVDPDLRFGQIWSNPPIRIGKPAMHELLLSWLERLDPEGSAHLVVSKHLGSDSLARWLQNQDFAVARRGSRMGYRLLDVAWGSSSRSDERA